MHSNANRMVSPSWVLIRWNYCKSELGESGVCPLGWPANSAILVLPHSAVLLGGGDGGAGYGSRSLGGEGGCYTGVSGCYTGVGGAAAGYSGVGSPGTSSSSEDNMIVLPNCGAAGGCYTCC